MRNRGGMGKYDDNEYLRQEYFHLQDTAESFGEKSLTIKAWSVTLSVIHGVRVN